MQPNRKSASLDPGAIDQVLEGKPASSSDEAIRRVEETVAFLRTAPTPVARPESKEIIMARIAREQRTPQSVCGVTYSISARRPRSGLQPLKRKTGNDWVAPSTLWPGHRCSCNATR